MYHTTDPPIRSFEDLEGAIIDALMDYSHEIRQTRPKKLITYINLPLPLVMSDKLIGEQVINLGKNGETIVRVRKNVSSSQFEIELVDALSFVVRHERTEIVQLKEKIKRLDNELNRLRKENEELRSRRPPEAIAWNIIMGRK